MGGPGSGNHLFTPEHREKLRQAALKQHGKTPTIPDSNLDPKSGDGVSPSNSGGNNPSNNDGLTPKLLVSGGGPLSPVPPKTKIGREIQRIERPLEVTLDSNVFFKGLPAFARLTFRAMNNIIKIFTMLPFIPFEFEIEDMTQEESQTFSEAIKPALEIALPTAGKKHPFILLGWAFIVGVLGKLKAKWKDKKNAKTGTGHTQN